MTDTATCRDCKAEVEVVQNRFVQHGDCPGWFALVDDEDGWKRGLESRFTEPRFDCPYPHRWHSRDADSTEHEVSRLVAAFVGALRPDIVVETGTAWGQTAQVVGEVLQEGGYGGMLHTVEPDTARVEHCRRLLEGLPVTVHQEKSLDWIADIDGLGAVDGEVGFAWFDSLHHLRVPEFRALHPFMASGAFVGFHDTGPHQGTLADEILQLEKEGLLLPVFLPTPRGVCFAEVLK